MKVERILATRYAVDLKPPEGVTRMYNHITEKYYTWNGKKWLEKSTAETILLNSIPATANFSKKL